MTRIPGLEFRDVHKSFGAVRALTGVSFGVLEREAHAIVGENGAGKSTLLKILAGIVRPDAGDILWRDLPLGVESPRGAIDRGVGMVYQEMLCFPNLSVSANIFAGRERCRAGWLRDGEMRDRARAILDRLYLRIDPDALAESLSTAHRQLLQVARALAFDCQILVLDEPTTALTDAEADHLFDVLGDLKRGGTTILYVSHRLPEVFRLCDRISVLRDGGYVGTFSRADVEPRQIVKAMVGRDLGAKGVRGATAVEGAEVLGITRLTREPSFRDITLGVNRGEIVGVFGLVGSGRSELLETIFGVRQYSAGEIRVEGRAVRFHSVRDAGRAGVALVPEERQQQGLLFNLSVRHNLVLPGRAIRGDVFVRGRTESAEAATLMREWRIRASGVDALPETLSGGNQQKVVAAKWLATRPRVLLLDEPTKGVDVGAKFEIHELIRREANEGVAVLVVSSDLPEILALADRILVMREGHLQGELNGADATEERVMHLATAGGSPQ